MNPYDPSQVDVSGDPSDPTFGPNAGDKLPTTLAATARVAGIIRFALIGGIVFILAVLGVLGPGQNAGDDPAILVLVGTVAWVVSVAASFVVPRLMVPGSPVPMRAKELARAIADIEKDEVLPPEVFPLIGRFMTQSLIAAALWEGPAVINLIFWFISGSPVPLIWVLLSLCLLVVTFPSVARLRQSIVRALELPVHSAGEVR